MPATPPIRPLRAEDAPAVSAFFSSAHGEDPAIRPVAEDAWRRFAALATNGGGAEFRVAEEAGRIVGLLTSTVLPLSGNGRRVRHLRILVHPGFRRRGLGSALLGHAEGQPLPPPRPTLQAYVLSTWTAALAFYAARGFARVHEDHEMEREGPPPAAREVPGFLLRPFGREGDAAAWARLHNESFRGEFIFVPYAEENVAADLGLAGARAWMAEPEAGGAPAGICFTHLESADRGCVQSLAVDARIRRRGLGRALLVAGLRTLAEQGRASVELGVDGDNPAARALYESEGFRVRERSFTLWRDR